MNAQKQIARVTILFAVLLQACVPSVLHGQYAQPVQDQPDRNSAAPREAPRSEFVVLANGNVIVGRLEITDGKASVYTSSGSRLVFTPGEIDFTCDSLDQVYWEKLARIKAIDTEGQVRLFRWCVSNKLLDQAKNQLEILAPMNIGASELGSLERHLMVAIEQQQSIRAPEIAPRLRDVQRLTEQPSRSIVAGPAGLNDLNIRRLPPVGQPNAQNQYADTGNGEFRPLQNSHESTFATDQPGMVRQVGYEQDVIQPGSSGPQGTETSAIAPQPGTQPTAAQRNMPSNRELDRLTRSFDGEVISFYKSRVEPILTRSCYTAGCHDANAEAMPLERMGRTGSIPRRMSQRNLYTILKYTDSAQPLHSAVLYKALTEHGNREAMDEDQRNDSVLRIDSIQLKHLATWLIAISNNPAGNHQFPRAWLYPQPAAGGTAATVRTPAAPRTPENSPLDAARNFDAEFGDGSNLMDGLTFDDDGNVIAAAPLEPANIPVAPILAPRPIKVGDITIPNQDNVTARIEDHILAPEDDPRNVDAFNSGSDK